MLTGNEKQVRGLTQRSADLTCIILWLRLARIFVALKPTICPQAMSILRRQFCTFLESKRRMKWTAEFCPKQWLAAIKSRLREKRKRRQSKLKKIYPQGVGDNRFAFRVWARQFISTKATAHLLLKLEEAVIDIKNRES